jgi:hypothetical protein
MNALLINRKVYTINDSNVRDGIINTIRKEMPGTAFAKPLIDHLLKMGKKSLDKYNDLELHLGEYNITLRFRTGRADGEAMAYTLDTIAGEPNEAFKKRWTDVFRVF